MYVVYILQSENLSYVGMTNDFIHRWRQHNGFIKGGARYTKKASKWEPVCIIDGFINKQQAMQCEWKLKSRKNKISRSFKGAIGRIKYLDYLLNNEDKWTSNSPLIKEQNLNIYINKEYKHFLNYLTHELYMKIL